VREREGERVRKREKMIDILVEKVMRESSKARVSERERARERKRERERERPFRQDHCIHRQNVIVHIPAGVPLFSCLAVL